MLNFGGAEFSIVNEKKINSCLIQEFVRET